MKTIEKLKFIPLASPDLQPADIEAAVAVMQSGMLVQGERVKAFEEEVARYLGVKHARCAANGTATLHLALTALGIGPGDEVIIPALSYIATANAVELVGAKPVFVDVHLDTFNIDADRIEQAITPHTKVIMPVHEFGLCADIHRIQEIAAKHNLFLIEDAACALGAKENNRFAGTFGHFGSFSLHPRKAISSGEGGILTTNDDSLAERISILRNHGIAYEGDKMTFVAAGFNYRLTDIQAALVHSQFMRLDKILNYKSNLTEIYYSKINNPKVILPTVPKTKKHTWQSFHVLLDESLDRDVCMKQLKEQGIGTNYGAQCIPDQQYYAKKYQIDAKLRFPNAFKAFRQGLVLPLYEKLNEDDLIRIANAVNQLAQ